MNLRQIVNHKIHGMNLGEYKLEVPFKVKENVFCKCFEVEDEDSNIDSSEKTIYLYLWDENDCQIDGMYIYEMPDFDLTTFYFQVLVAL